MQDPLLVVREVVEFTGWIVCEDALFRDSVRKDILVGRRQLSDDEMRRTVFAHIIGKAISDSYDGETSRTWFQASTTSVERGIERRILHVILAPAEKLLAPTNPVQIDFERFMYP